MLVMWRSLKGYHKRKAHNKKGTDKKQRRLIADRGKVGDLRGVHCLRASPRYGPVIKIPGESAIGGGW